MEAECPASDDSVNEEDEEDEDSALLPVRRPLRGRAAGKHFSQRKRKAGSFSSGTAQQNSRGRPPKRQSHRVAQASRGSSSDEIKETWTQADAKFLTKRRWSRVSEGWSSSGGGT